MIKKDFIAINGSYLLGWLSQFKKVFDLNLTFKKLPCDPHLIYLDDEIFEFKNIHRADKIIPEFLFDSNHVFITKIKWVDDLLLSRGIKTVFFPWFHVIDNCISMHLLGSRISMDYPSEDVGSYFCLNRCDRDDRYQLVKYLHTKNILSSGRVTYRGRSLDIPNIYEGDDLKDYVCSDQGFERHQTKINDVECSSNVVNYININQHYRQPLNISVETLTAFEFFPTEKSFLAFATKRLPLIYAFSGRIQTLKNQGFDLFDWLLDHSYDAVPDYEKRMYQMINHNYEILKNGIVIDNKIKDSLDYNYNYLINDWLTHKLHELKEKIEKLL